MPRFRHFPTLLFTILTACTGERGGSAARLVYYESYDPRSLDPALSTDVPTGEMVTLLYDGLTRFDANGALQPALADRWSVDATGLRYVFHLRPGVQFHDGSALTADAVRRSFLRVLDPKSTGGRAWPLLPIDGASPFAAGATNTVNGIAVLGDTAVALTLTHPLAVFPKFLAMPVASIVAPAPGATSPPGPTARVRGASRAGPTTMRCASAATPATGAAPRKPIPWWCASSPTSSCAPPSSSRAGWMW